MARGSKGGKLNGGKPKRTGTSSGGRPGDIGTSNLFGSGRKKPMAKPGKK